MANEKETAQFVIFDEYRWSGPNIDEALLGAGVSAADLYRCDGPWHNRSTPESPLLQVAGEAKVGFASRTIAARFELRERPDLFFELSAVELTMPGIMAFVAKHGLLNAKPLRGPPRSNALLVTKDSFADFIGHVGAIRLALGMVSDIRRAEEERRGNAWKIRLKLADHINDYLVGTRTILDDNLQFITPDARLVDAIWFQLAEAVTKGLRANKCAHCGKFFVVGGGSGRTDKQWCGNSCMVAAYRARKRKASEMRAAGATLREISKKTGSDISTIKAWLELKGE